MNSWYVTAFQNEACRIRIDLSARIAWLQNGDEFKIFFQIYIRFSKIIPFEIWKKLVPMKDGMQGGNP